MAWLMTAAPYIGMGVTAVGQTQEGIDAKIEGETVARQYEINAGQEQAHAQRRAIERRREARLVESRARAMASYSGGGASDPTVTKILDEIAGEGEYRAALELYEGDERARALNLEADAARRGGDRAIKASRYRAAGTALSGASSLYGKYGGYG